VGEEVWVMLVKVQSMEGQEEGRKVGRMQAVEGVRQEA
jgi:hypothetical protein